MTNPVHREARRLADHLNDTIPPDFRPFRAPVASVVAGGGRFGGALVTVTRGGVNLVASGGYLNAYTPVVGDWVVCFYIENQLFVLGKPVGQP